MIFKVYVTDIDWCIEDTDVADQNEMEEVLAELPTEIHMNIEEPVGVNFDENSVLLEEAITEELINIYGWLVNSYSYVIE